MSAPHDPVGSGLKAYADYFTGLTEHTVDRISGLVTEDVRFSDPFNTVQGVDRLRTIFAATFRDCRDVRFLIDGMVRQQNEAFLKWRFFFRPRRLGPGPAWEISGVSELHLTPDGRVRVHIDHWDSGSQFYARMPVIGVVIRWLRGRLGAH